jgi:aspartate aminotransferase
MPIAEKMIPMVEGMAMVKQMFEEGARLKAEHGLENVFDFSLGNPDVPPPSEFKKVLRNLVNDDPIPDTRRCVRQWRITSARNTMWRFPRI